jgi:flagellin
MVASIGSSGNQSHLRYLDRATKEKEKSLAKLASGEMNRLENPAAAAIVAELEAGAVIHDQASRNIGDAGSLIAIAEGALAGVNESVDRIRELTVQASNGTYSGEQRAAMQAEISQLSEEVNRTLQSTEFNGQKVFDQAANPELSVQVGAGSDANSSITFAGGNIAEAAADLLSIDVTSADGRASAISSVDGFQKQVTAQRGEIGAFQARLEVADEAARKSSESSQAAASRIRDIDYAQETARLTQNTILQQSAVAMSAHANLSQQAVLRLLS